MLFSIHGVVNMETYENIKYFREKRGMSQEELAIMVGYKDRSSIAKIESGRVDLSQSKIAAFAKALGVSPARLMGFSDEDYPASDSVLPISTRRFPLLGNVACGEPIFADEHFEAYVSAGASIDADFCLRAKGDSMIGARIQDGDIVFIRKQEMVEDGEIAAVLIEDEATLKRVHYDREAGVLQLFAENPQFKTMRFSGDELNRIRILGKAVAFQSDVK